MSVSDDVKSIVSKLPDAFQSDRAGNTNATIQINLTGEGASNWTLKIDNGALSVDEGTSDNADMTLTMEAEDYVALAKGEANPMGLFASGRIQLEGDMGLAMKFQQFFDMG